MSTLGQALGGLVGGAIGFFVGGPTGALYGAQIGMTAGGLLDPQKIKGPRLEDLSFQSSTYGAFVPRLYGTIAVSGNVFWLNADKLNETEKTTSGKGGPQITTYTYSATFAVGLCEGPIAGLRRLWIGSDLIYDAESDDLETIVESRRRAREFTLYLGTDTQEADPLIQADRGVDNVPAYRGLAYIVFHDLALEKYGNSLVGAQVRAEVVTSGTPHTLQQVYSRDISYTEADPVRVHSSEKSCIIPITRDLETQPVFRTLLSDGYVWNSSTQYSHYLFRSPAIGFSWRTAGGWADADTSYTVARIVESDATDFVFVTANQTRVYWHEDQSVAFYVDTFYSSTQTHELFSLVVGNHLWLIFRRTTTSLVNVRVIDTADISSGYHGTLLATETHSLPYIYGTYDAMNGEVILCHSDTLYFYTSSGALIRSVIAPQAIALTNSMNVSTDGVNFYTFEVSSSWRILKVFSLDTGRLLRTHEINLSGLGAAASYGYVVDDILYFLNDNNSPEKRILAYRLPVGFTANPVTLAEIVSAECRQSALIGASDIVVSSLADEVRGYRVSQGGPIRNGIDQLRTVWPFDARQHGYQIEFVRRGTSSVATIPASDLGAIQAGQEASVQVTHRREMDVQLPRSVTLKYLDVAREYDINEASEERINTDAVNESVIDIPVVLNAQEAKQTAATLLYMAWLARHDIAFNLPPAYAYLEPADVVTIEAGNATYVLRPDRISYTAAGVVECEGKYEQAAIYTQVAVADEGQSVGQALRIAGPTLLIPMDVPLLRDADDETGFIAAMGGYSATWPGASLYSSTDNGNTWTAAKVGTPPPGAQVGYALTTLGAAISTAWDAQSILLANFIYYSPASATEEQVFAGQNWFAYGSVANGWEIIAVRTVVDNGGGNYTLRDFLRGQYGTEWATGTHAEADYLVLLDDAALQFVAQNSATIGAYAQFIGLTAGRTLDVDEAVGFTYRAVNLECLAPVNAAGSRDPSTSQWTIGWTRQSRYPGWRDYTDAPLGETVESYEIDIYSDHTYTTVVRTLTSNAQSVGYASASQIADFGIVASTLFCKIYQLSDLAGRGRALVSAVSMPGTVVSLLHFNGTDASTTIADETAATWTVVGDAQLDTGYTKFGSASCLFDGTGDRVYRTIPAIGTGDFTIEMFVRPNTGGGSSGARLLQIGANSTNGGLWLYKLTSYPMRIELQTYGGGAYQTVIPVAASTGFDSDTWGHVALVRQNGVFRLYINGVLGGSGTSIYGNITQTTLSLGADTSNANSFRGNIDEFRLVTDRAIYTNNFTAPAAPFTL